MSEILRITSIRFRNYKAFREYSISLNPFNVLVGPNNAGKSTVLVAIRILSEGIRRARARNYDLIEGPKGNQVRAYPVRLEGLPISTENVFHNYDESTPATVEFRLSNGNSLNLYFPERGVCYMIPTSEQFIRSPSDFRNPKRRCARSNGTRIFAGFARLVFGGSRPQTSPPRFLELDAGGDFQTGFRRWREDCGFCLAVPARCLGR